MIIFLTQDYQVSNHPGELFMENLMSRDGYKTESQKVSLEAVIMLPMDRYSLLPGG